MTLRPRHQRARTALVAFALLAGLPACMPEPGCDGPDGPTYSAMRAQTSGPACDPPPPCEGCGGGSGDPHISTFDQRRYDLQTAAELVVARNADRTFEVQWRQEPYGSTRTAGITTVAVRLGGSRVTVAGEGPVVRVDGEERALDSGETLLLPAGVAIHGVDRQVIVTHEPSGASVHIQPDDKAMGVLVDPPESDEGELRGLLGDADGDPNNDIVLADGTAVEEAGWDLLHPELAEAWRVTDDDTLFDYEGDAGPDTYWDPTFPGREVRLDDFTNDERSQAEAVCRAAGVSDPGLLEDCTFDVLVTGDPSVAELFARQQVAAGIDLTTGDRASDTPMGLDDGATDWSTIIPGTTNASDAIAAGGVVLVQGHDSEQRADVLVALSLEDGTVLWEVHGVYRHSGVTVAGDTVVAVATADGPLAGPGGRRAIVGIDLRSGEPLDDVRHDPDRDAGERNLDSSGTFATIGDTVVHVAGRWAVGLGAEGLDFRWEVELPGTRDVGPLPAASVAGGDLLWLAWRASDELGVGLLDPADGDMVASLAAPEWDGIAMAGVAVESGFVASTTDGGSAGLARVDADGTPGSLRLVSSWVVDLDDEQRAAPDLALAGDVIVGYTDATTLSGFDPADGERLWDVRPTSFNNNDRRVAGDGRGASYIASTGGAYLESYGPGGTERWALEPEDVAAAGNPGGVSVVGPVVGDVVIAVSHSEDGLLVVAVPTGNG